jgi:hypothetical protein
MPEDAPLDLAGSLAASAIEVRAEQAVAPKQCGERAEQAFRYVAWVVPGASPESARANVISGGSFPCFADALFTNLPREGSYTVAIHSFSKATWDSGKSAIDALTQTRAPVDEASGELQKLSPIASVACTVVVKAGTRVVANCTPQPDK